MLLEIAFWALVAGIAVVAVVAAGARRSASTPAVPQRSPGTFVASIDGSRWAANATVRVTWRAGILALAGVDEAGCLISIGVNGQEAGVRQQIGAGGPANALLLVEGESWVANAAHGSGEVTLTALTPNRIAGQFSFVASAASPGAAAESRRVCDGWFDVPVEPPSG